MSNSDYHEGDPCIAESCYNDALFCSIDCAIEYNKVGFLYNLTNALWLVYSHAEFDKIAARIALDSTAGGMLRPIDGNDHPLLIELAENILRRYERIK